MSRRADPRARATGDCTGLIQHTERACVGMFAFASAAIVCAVYLKNSWMAHQVAAAITAAAGMVMTHA